jgi:hypothetical protein
LPQFTTTGNNNGKDEENKCERDCYFEESGHVAKIEKMLSVVSNLYSAFS